MLSNVIKASKTLLVLGALTVGARQARAIELDLGLGESYSSLCSNLGSSTAWHSGLGYVGEVRLGLGNRRKSVVLEIFGFYESSELTNTNSTQVETNKRTGFGGGVDLIMKHVFVGASAERVSSDITTSGTLAASLKYPEFAARAGFVFNISPRISLMIGGTYGIGSATFTSTSGSSVSAESKAYKGFALFNLNLFTANKYEK